MIEELKSEIEILHEFRNTKTNSTVRRALHKAIQYIDKEVKEQERRNEFVHKKIIVNGKPVLLPAAINFGGEEYTYHLKNHNLYLIHKGGHNEDGSFHFWNYVWIKDKTDKKYVKLLVRALGGDKYGDRIFTEARYYKTVKDRFPYMEKHVNPKGKYKEYVNEVIFMLRELEGMENFFK